MTDWRRHLALGLVHYMAYPETMTDSGLTVGLLEPSVLDETFSVIEVTHVASAGDRRRARRLLETAGLRVNFAGTAPLAHSGLSLSALDRVERERAVAFARGLVDEAVEMGAEMAFFIGGPDPGPSLRAPATAALAESLHELCAYGRKAAGPGRLRLAIEPGDREVDHRELVGPFGEAAPLAEGLRREFPEFGLVIDLSHLHQLGEDRAAVIRRSAPYAWDFHLANAVLDDPADPRYGDKHPRFGVPGGRVGTADLAEYIRQVLEGTTAAGCPQPGMSIEVRPGPDEDSDVALASSKRSFLDAWAMIGR